MTVQIRKETLKDGSVRWRARGVSTGRWDATGKRRQVTLTGKTKKEVEREVARINGQVSDGTYTPRWDGTVAELCSDYLKSAGFEREANTRVSYRGALLPVTGRLGTRKARSITRQDVESLRDWLLTSGRKRGGKPGSGLGARSVRLTLGRLSAAFEMACEDGRLPANPCRHVRLPAQTPREPTTWTADELRRWLAVASADRLAACWLLSALGLRRGEVLGLRWEDVSFAGGTITVRRARVLVDARVVEKSPKSRRSERTLPLFEPVTGALAGLEARQRDEQDAAGAAYADSGYVAADELGAPLYPERLTDEFARLCRAAGVPQIRLHDCRGTLNGILERAGVPDSVRAAWLGHTVTVNRSAYLAPPPDLSAVSVTIGRLFAPT